MGHGADWRYIFQEPPAGYRLIAPDLRGHGASTNPSGSFTFRECASDLRGLLRHLRLPRVKAIGLSGGGIAALHMATAEPGCMEAMVLVSAPPCFPPAARSIQRRFSEAMLGDAEMARMRQRHRRGEPQIQQLFAIARGFAVRAAIPRSHLWVVPNGGQGPVFREAAPHFVETALSFLRGDWRRS